MWPGIIRNFSCGVTNFLSLLPPPSIHRQLKTLPLFRLDKPRVPNVFTPRTLNQKGVVPTLWPNGNPDLARIPSGGFMNLRSKNFYILFDI